MASEQEVKNWLAQMPPAARIVAREPITLANCSAIKIWFEPDGLTAVNIWRDGPHLWRPVKKGQAYRELQPGDEMTAPDGKIMVVRSVEVFR